MFRFVSIILLLCFHMIPVEAATITCSVAGYADWSGEHVPFELKPSGLTMTLGSKIADWQVLYTAHANIGMQTVSCGSSQAYGGSLMYFTLLTDAQPVNTVSGNAIYSTNVPGIGVSVSASQVTNAAVKSYPSVVYYASPNLGYGFWADIKFWKIPGNIPMNNGPITVTGPDAAVVLMSSGSVYSSSDPERVTDDGKAYVSSSRILTLTMMFQPGTCNIEGDNVNVNMGDYDGSDGHSSWKDASFKLICPNAMGYDGKANSGNGYDFPLNIQPTATITANDKKNGRVQVSIEPYTQVIDANKGIIALDGTGAQGYGIQLAWGEYSSQGSGEPLNPVILNSYVDANKLNSGFSAGDTPIGGNGFTGTDNTIKMAARYIRTTGDTTPGPANAVVQVIANYQ